jgi:hypothetical protein
MSSLGDRKREFGSGAVLRQLLEIAVESRQEVSGWRNTPADPAAYDGAFARIASDLGDAQKRLNAERAVAGARWEALESHPQGRRLVRIRNDRRFQTWGFFNFLLLKSRQLAADDSHSALEAADLALAVARCLNPAEYGEERTEDFKSEAFAAIAEAKRDLGDLTGAWKAFDLARTALDAGTGDPLDRAEMELLRSRLLYGSGLQEEGEQASRRAVNLFRRIGDRRLEAGSAVQVEHPEAEGRAARL